jgi:hypothetical protein
MEEVNMGLSLTQGMNLKDTTKNTLNFTTKTPSHQERLKQTFGETKILVHVI